MWVRKLSDREKDFGHLEQEYNILPLCVLWCVFRLLDMEKDLSQKVQGKSCSPVWVRWCDFKLEEHENNFSQIVQSKGFSPECVQMWVFSWLELGKVLSHTWHMWYMVVSRLGATGRHQTELHGWYQLITKSEFGQHDLRQWSDYRLQPYIRDVFEAIVQGLPSSFLLK